MTTNNSSPLKTLSLVRMGFATALICSMASFAGNIAFAQDTTSQRLPDTLVQQQTPPAFPDDILMNPSGGTTPATPATEPVPTTAEAVAAKNPAQSPPQTAAATQTIQETPSGEKTTTAQVPAEKAGGAAPAATTPPANAIPAQPEERKLVPSQPMGTDAKNVQSGQGGADTATTSAAPEAVEYPVDDFGADQNETAAQDTDAPAPGLPDAFEKYTSKSNEAADLRAAAEGANGDALPEVSNLNMVKLQGRGFDNASGQNSSVAVDGELNEVASKKLQEEIRSEAFDAAITGMFPLSPAQIEGLLKRYDSTQKVVAKPPYDLPTPEISVQNISLDPGMVPPVIETAVGNVTTINMLDATGAPWPVQDVTWAGDYEVVEPEEGGHIVRITPMSHFAHGNIVIRLLTLKTPLTMTLKTGRDVVQYRVDARIPEYGPFANAPIMQGAKSSLVAGSPDLTSLLDGVMPGGMVKLEVAGVDGRTTAYSGGGLTYIRTPLTLLSPAWQSSVSSADGMNVYALNNAPVLLLSDGGEFMRATLKEKEGLLDE